MNATITKLTARESRILSAINSMKRSWIDRKPFSNREQPAWDLVEQAVADLDELRAELLDGEDHREEE